MWFQITSTFIHQWMDEWMNEWMNWSIDRSINLLPLSLRFCFRTRKHRRQWSRISLMNEWMKYWMSTWVHKSIIWMKVDRGYRILGYGYVRIKGVERLNKSSGLDNSVGDSTTIRNVLVFLYLHLLISVRWIYLLPCELISNHILFNHPLIFKGFIG